MRPPNRTIEIKENLASPHTNESVRSVITITEHLAYLYAIAILVVLPIIATLLKGMEGAIVSLIIVVVTLPITVNILRSVKTISLSRFFQASRHLIGTKYFALALLTLVNVGIICNVSLQTLIPIYSLIAMFLMTSVAACVAVLFGLKIKTPVKLMLISIGLMPLLVNCFFLMNFLFSSHPQKESYHYTQQTQAYYSPGRYSLRKSGIQVTSSIILENNHYSMYPGIRSFWDYKQVASANRITYTIEKGLFGIPVVTHYQFK